MGGIKDSSDEPNGSWAPIGADGDFKEISMGGIFDEPLPPSDGDFFEISMGGIKDSSDDASAGLLDK